MRKNKVSVLILILAIVVLLSGCGSRFAIPEDWVYMTYEEAVKLYHAVDFTVDNVNDYFTINERKEECHNERDEIESVSYETVWGLNSSNYVRFDTPEDEFLMDYTYTYLKQTLKLDPSTLEVIEVLNENTFEKRDTFNGNPFEGIVISYYKVYFEKV